MSKITQPSRVKAICAASNMIRSASCFQQVNRRRIVSGKKSKIWNTFCKGWGSLSSWQNFESIMTKIICYRAKFQWSIIEKNNLAIWSHWMAIFWCRNAPFVQKLKNESRHKSQNIYYMYPGRSTSFNVCALCCKTVFSCPGSNGGHLSDLSLSNLVEDRAMESKKLGVG